MDKKKYQIQLRVSLQPLGDNGQTLYQGSIGSSALTVEHWGVVEVGSLMEGAALIDKFDTLLNSVVEPGSFNLGKNFQ